MFASNLTQLKERSEKQISLAIGVLNRLKRIVCPSSVRKMEYLTKVEAEKELWGIDAIFDNGEKRVVRTIAGR